MNIVLSGYYGFGNLGDELLLAATLQGLRRRLPGVRPIVLSGDPERTEAEHGVRAVRRDHPLRVAAALRGARLLLSGSGSLLQDATGPFNVPYYLGVIQLARRYGVPVMIFAQGVGPLRGAVARMLVRRVLGGVQAITLRDPGSFRALRELGVRGVPVEVTADPVLALRVDEAGSDAGLPDLPARYVVVNVRRRGLDDAGALRLGAALARLLAGAGWAAVFLPMQVPEDVEAAARVAAGLGGAVPVVTIRNPLPPAAAVRLLRGAEAVLAMRLHALVLACLAGGAPFGISYDPKVDAFLARLGQEPLADTRLLPDEDELARRIEGALAARRRVAAQIAAALPPLRAAAERNFDWVEALVRGEPLPPAPARGT